MLPTKKDHPCLHEQAIPVWHVPTVPNWKESTEKERENLSLDAGRRTHTPSTPNSQPSLMGMKKNVSIKVIPSPRLVESSDAQRKRPIPTIPGDLWKKHPAPWRRPIPTIPPGGTLLETSPIYQPISTGESMGNTSSVIPKSQERCVEATSSAPRKRPIPTIPPGGTLLETSPICQPIPAVESIRKSSSVVLTSPEKYVEATSSSMPVKASKMTARKSTTRVYSKGTGVGRLEPPQDSAATSSRMSVIIAPSTADKTHDGVLHPYYRVGGSDKPQPLTGGNLFYRPILTGESMGTPSTPVTPKRRWKSKKIGEPNPRPTKPTAPNKSTGRVPVPSKKHSSYDDETTSTKDKFILTTPPEFRYKGAPPRWIRALYLEPLLDGWKREVRTRATTTNAIYDIYYYNPEGRRFRSRIEIGKYLLEKGITKYSAAFNFCFKGLILGGEFEPYEMFSANKKRPDALGTVQNTLPEKSKPPKKKRPSSYLPQVPLFSPVTHPELADMDYSEEGMVFDEEIEVVGTGDGQDAIFDPAVLSLRNQPVAMNIPKMKEPRETFSPPKKQPRPSTSNSEDRSSSRTSQLFCICDDVEHGNMVLCDNIKCEIGWFHFRCVNITSAPAGFWYCPICRGASSDNINTNIALGK